MSIRKRLSSEDSRAAALEAARGLLIEVGPQAVTLKAVAERIGRTHANLLHHFGSASGLHKALAGYLAGTVRASIHDAVRATQTGVGSARAVVGLRRARGRRRRTRASTPEYRRQREGPCARHMRLASFDVN